MKAGMTINAKQLELLGGKVDDVPSVLYTEDGTTEVRVGKFFYAPATLKTDPMAHPTLLVSRSGERFVADKDGWVTREQQQAE